MKLKLSEIKDPVFELELLDGSTRSYDPWELAEKFGKPQEIPEQTSFDAIRRAMNLPTQAEVDAAPEPKPWTPSRHACMEIQASLMEFISKLGVVGKLKGLAQQS